MAAEIHHRLSYAPLNEPVASRLDALFGVENSLIEVNPGHVLMPPKYKDIGDRILDMKVREDDIWLVSLPRTGSTWTQEMVWLIANDLDYEGAKVIQHLRTPLLELSAVLAQGHDDFMKNYGDSVELVERIPGRRFIKTHLPIELLPHELLKVKPKIVYVARNPKDMCVSYYHYCVLIHNLQATFEEFCELFLADNAPIGPAWNHMLGFWRLRDEPNVMFVKYEDMKRDQIGHIKRATKFLEKPDLTDEQISKLSDHLSFGSMKRNRAVNLEPIMEQSQGAGYMQRVGIEFIRKGRVGDWKNHMTEEMSARFDRWMEEHLDGSGLTFD